MSFGSSYQRCALSLFKKPKTTWNVKRAQEVKIKRAVTFTGHGTKKKLEN